MSLLVSLYAAILFFILTPNVLLRLPKNGSKFTVALVHAAVFGLIFWLTHKFIWRMTHRLEGMEEKKEKDEKESKHESVPEESEPQ
uniref:Uncharacterized protein n=1 Tax=viral metagenome TaxID=1070528 RepID=A0A6C0I0I8_9ZZZZ